jgi:cysteine desulfurase
MDHQAGMPVDQRVVEVMIPYMDGKYGNPASLHSWGQETKRAVEAARNQVAKLVGAESIQDIIFTSGGTESNNIALIGSALRNKDRGDHIITTKIEHISIVNICKHLQRQGFKITYLPVDKYGTVDMEALKASITDKTILISVMYASNEIGTIEPIREIGELAHEKNILFHVDGVAAVGRVPVNVKEEHIDLLSISSNDMYGSKGVGALYTAKGARIIPVTFGGGQERGLRSGTENIPGIVGMGKASEIAGVEMEKERVRLSALRDKIIHGVLSNIPESYLNGHPTMRISGNVNLRFSYIEGESLTLSLDMEGIAASSGSACSSKTLEPSATLLAIGLSHEEAHGSLLLSLGKQNTEEDVDYLLQVLPGIVKRLRAMSPLTPKELR